MHFYNEQSFWYFLSISFTSIVAAIRWLIGVFFKKQSAVNLEKSKLDLSVEHLKADTSLRTIEGLSKFVVELVPRIKKLEEVNLKFETSVAKFDATEKNMISAMEPLKVQYEEFNRIVPKVTASMQTVIDEVAKIKTEVIQLKKGSPNVFVTQKK